MVLTFLIQSVLCSVTMIVIYHLTNTNIIVMTIVMNTDILFTLLKGLLLFKENKFQTKRGNLEKANTCPQLDTSTKPGKLCTIRTMVPIICYITPT